MQGALFGSGRRKSLTLSIQPSPANINRLGSHWSTRSREVKRVQQQVWWQLIQFRKETWPRPPLLVHCHRIGRGKAMDPTGIIESLKGVLDGCVTAGFLPDDSDKFIKIEHPSESA